MDVDYGSVLVTPQFVDCGSSASAIKLGSLTPTDKVAAAWNVELVYLTADGGSDEDHDYMWDGTKWVNLITSADASNVDIPAGQGLWVSSGIGGVCQLQSAGQIGTSDIVYPLNEDYGSVGAGNGFPLTVKLGEIALESEADLAWNVELVYLTADGGSDEDHDYMWDGTKWVNLITSADAGNVDIPAGQGFWVSNGAGSAASIHIPAPEL